jgi:hypothetical protein
MEEHRFTDDNGLLEAIIIISSSMNHVFFFLWGITTFMLHERFGYDGF